MFSDRDYARYRRPARSAHQPSMLMTLIIANVVVFAIQLLFPGFTELIWLSVPGLKKLELWRLGTHMFAHSPGSFFHILLNMWGLYIFGKPLEMRVGPNRFLHIYLLSGLIGAGAWLLFNWTNQIPMLGASGAVMGIMAAAAISFPNLQYMLLFPPIPMKLKTFAVVFGAIEVISLLGKQGQGNIAHLAHLGGMAGGFIYMYWIFPGSGRHRPYNRYNQRSFFDNLKRRIRGWFLEKKFTVKNPHGSGGNRSESDEEATSAEVDRILDKIGEKGLSSLTQRERELLEKARERLKGKH